MSRTTEGVRSVHFPEPPRATPEPAPKDANVLQTFSDALRDTELVRARLRGLLTSETRHGDLQIALSAARRVCDNLQSLIEHEERS